MASQMASTAGTNPDGQQIEGGSNKTNQTKNNQQKKGGGKGKGKGEVADGGVAPIPSGSGGNEARGSRRKTAYLDIQRERQNANEKMADLEAEKYELKKKVQSLEEQKEAIHKDYENSQSELKDLTTKLDQKSAEWRATDTKLSNANARVKVLENELYEAKTVIANKDLVIAKKIEEASTRAKYAENSATETKQLRAEIEEANNAKRALELVKTNLDEQVQQLNLDLLASIGFKGERDRVLQALDDLKLEITESHGQIEELQAELEGFKRKPNKADRALGGVGRKGQALGIELEDLAGSDDDESEEVASVPSPDLLPTGGTQKVTREDSLGGDSTGNIDGIATEESELSVINTEAPRHPAVTSTEAPVAPTVGNTEVPLSPTVVDTGASCLSPMVVKVRHMSPFILWIRVYFDIFVLFCQWALQLQHWRSSSKASKLRSNHFFDLPENNQIAIVTKSFKTWVHIPQAVLRRLAKPEYEFPGREDQQLRSTDLPEVKFEFKAVQFWDCFAALLAHIFVYGVVAVCLYHYNSLKMERGIWLQANELTRQVVVQLRGQSGIGSSYSWTIFGQQKWLEVLSFNLVSSWLPVDRSFPG